MKRHGHLFEQAFTRESLYQAYLDARRHKRSKRSCHRFETQLAKNLNDLYEELRSGYYKPRPYFRFDIYEPKKRTIYAPAFRDCVVQHAIYRIIYPIFDKTFIHHSYACRKGKGTHRAADYAQTALRKTHPDTYTLKLDVRKFFYRIDRPVLKKLIEQKIKDRRFVGIMMQFAEYGEHVGIPIGNLLSQLYALIYLNPMDQFIKRELKVKWYVRYVDDSVLFGLTYEEAQAYKLRIEQFLKETLHLELSKYSIARSTKGINFVGYRTWRRKRFIRKMALIKTRRSILRNQLESVISHIGHARKTCSLQHILNQTQELNHALYRSLPASLRRLHHIPHSVRATGYAPRLARCA